MESGTQRFLLSLPISPTHSLQRIKVNVHILVMFSSMLHLYLSYQYLFCHSIFIIYNVYPLLNRHIPSTIY